MMMKIDCHVHLYARSKKSGGYIRPGFVRERAMAWVARRFGVHRAKSDEEAEAIYLEYLARSVENSELDRAILLAFDQLYAPDGSLDEKRSRFYVPNAFVRDSVAAYPERFLFGASVHPFRRDALDALEEQKALGAVVVKLLPNSHGFDPADNAIIPYYKKLADLGLPLLVHCGFEHAIPVLDQSLGDPLLLRPALDQGVTVIIAHAGSAGRFHLKETFGGFLQVLEAYPNCYGDTSALANIWRTQYLKALLNPEVLEKKYGVAVAHPFERLIHGSDFPAPVTPLAFGFKNASAIRKTMSEKNNVLQLDIATKRHMGVPDGCLTLASKLLLNN